MTAAVWERNGSYGLRCLIHLMVRAGRGEGRAHINMDMLFVTLKRKWS